ncbi:mitochondrial distribution and morphology family 33, partial [Irpex lacteus]
VKERLRTWAENAAVALRGRADQYTSSAIKSFAQLGRELNKVTGYQEIEALKRAVASQGKCAHQARISAAREAAKEAKVAYDHAVHQRAKSQREVNDLLQRKSSWTDDDVGRFTALVRQDHLFEQAENRAKKAAQHTEDEVEREFSELMRVILNRYHEEQVWSDKIRSASTYGQLTVLGLNMFVFILAIILVEPWKRKRLAQTFERKVEEMTETTSKAFQDETRRLVEQLGKQADEIDRLREA